MTSNGEPYQRVRYKDIIQEQVILSYLTQGGVTYGDTEKMSPYDRKIALDTIQELLDGQKRAREDAIQKAKQERENKDPKSGLNSISRR